jgi:protein-tyrosine phosphatase
MIGNKRVIIPITDYYYDENRHICDAPSRRAIIAAHALRPSPTMNQPSNSSAGNGRPTFTRIRNFRDYGGYPRLSGNRLKSGQLFRSGHLGAASTEDLIDLSKLRLRAVIDLRGAQERQKVISRLPDGFGAAIVCVDGETGGLGAYLHSAGAVESAEQARRIMCAAYAGMPFRPHLVEVLRRYFETLAEADGPTLVHCMGGKDRTGLAVGLLHHLMGVDRETLLEDYTLTHQTTLNDAGGAVDKAWLRRTLGHALSEDALELLISVDPGFLLAAFEAIEARCGSIDAYLHHTLGVTVSRRAQIHARLVE